MVLTMRKYLVYYGFRYIVGSFKNISSVELDHVSVSFRLYDEDGNQIGNTVLLRIKLIEPPEVGYICL